MTCATAGRRNAAPLTFLSLVKYLRLHWPKLFPYTTLFRSDRRRSAVPRDRGWRRRLHPADLEAQGRGPPGVERRGGVRPPGDRKSTRLNSSHVEISYAVFCLKKKTERLAVNVSVIYENPRA